MDTQKTKEAFMERQSNTLGTVGTILGSIGTAGALGGAAKGLLGFGGGMPGCGGGMAEENAKLRARVSALESEKYTDGKFDALAQRTLQEQKEFFNYVLGIKGEVDTIKADYRVLQKDIECLAGKVNDNAIAANQGMAALGNRISGITKVVIPSAVVCGETNCNCSGGIQ
jgi:hypothetical protein